LSSPVARVVVLVRLLVVTVVAIGLSVSVTAGSASAAPGLALTGSFSGPGADQGLLSDPQRVALRTSTGELFVADRANDRVQVFDSATHALVGQFGDATTTDDPFGVAVNQATGDVYVSSATSSTITKWSDGGLGYTQALLFTSPAHGTDPAQAQAGEVFNFSAPLAVDPTSGDLLVADPTPVGDPAAQRIQRFDFSGAYVSSFDGASAPGGTFQGLRDIAIDAAGDIYVLDAGDSGRVLRFDATGTPDATTPVYDRVPGPALIAVDPTTGELVVASNNDNTFDVDRLYSYGGTTVESATVVPPGTPDATFPSGLAFDATGRLLVATWDVCGATNCGGTVAINAFERTATLTEVAATGTTNITEKTARLRGTLHPGGVDVTYTFEYTADGVSWTQVGDQGPSDSASPISVLADITGLADGTTYKVRLVARATAAPGLIVYSNVATFTTVNGDPPTAVIGASSDLTPSGATLNGTANPNSYTTGVRFEISGDGGGSFTALAGPDGDPGIDDPIGAGATDVAVSATTPVLEPNREYLTRLTGTSLIGTTSADATVTTLGEQALVDATAAGQVTTTSARLSGSVNPRNTDTSYHFEYGPTTAYGTSTATGTATSTLIVGGPDDPFDPATPARGVAEQIAGLQPGVTYHYRLVADNGNGPAAASGDQTFTTADPPSTPTTGVASDITTTTATVSGSVDTHGLAGRATFSIIQTDGNYSQSVGPVALNAVDGPQSVTATAAGLPGGGRYTVRIASSTSGGVRSGSPVSFSTNPLPGYQPPAPTPDDGTWATPPAADPPASNPGKPADGFTARFKVTGTLATFTIAVPGPGVVKASASKLTSATKIANDEGNVTLKVKLTNAGRKALRNNKSRKLTVKVTVAYTPTGATTKTITKSVTFTRGGGR
jgi:hypothetical protein